MGFKLGADGKPVALTKEEEARRNEVIAQRTTVSAPRVKRLQENGERSHHAEDEVRKPAKTKYNSKRNLAANENDVDAALIRACNRGNAVALRLYYQKMGGLTEGKEETKHELSASDRIAIGIQYREALVRELEDSGVCSVCHQRKALRNELCLDTESEYEEGGEVEALAVSS